MIVADFCCNHLGDMLLTYYMISAAKEAGVDAVKFQMYEVDKINDPTLHNFLRICRFTKRQHIELKCACEEVGIRYLCSAFDTESLEVLGEMGVMIKIPSGQIHNKAYLEKAASLDNTIIMSTGMATLDEVKDAVGILGNPAILHCTTAYPVSDEDVNLNCIITLRKEFPHCVIGYSDHTVGYEAAVAATVLGAEIVEKHFILSRAIKTPDTPVSLEPEELKQYVTQIRRTEKLMGTGVKAPTKSEEPNMFRRDFRKE